MSKVLIGIILSLVLAFGTYYWFSSKKIERLTENNAKLSVVAKTNEVELYYNSQNHSTPKLTTSATGTVIGTANTASSSRTKVSGTFLYKNGAGTATVGTDIKIYFTCNH